MPQLPIHPASGRTARPRTGAFAARAAAAGLLRAGLIGVALALATAPFAVAAAAESPPAQGAKKKAAAKKSGDGTDVAAASAGNSPLERAQASFEVFSREWMQKMERAARETAVAAKATVRRGYPSGFTTELKPTGQSTAPFVGLLRYVEEEHSCKDTSLTDCQVTSSTNVTEIFRFQGGKWVY